MFKSIASTILADKKAPKRVKELEMIEKLLQICQSQLQTQLLPQRAPYVDPQPRPSPSLQNQEYRFWLPLTESVREFMDRPLNVDSEMRKIWAVLFKEHRKLRELRF